MRHLKILFITLFAMVALFAVGYANSVPLQTPGVLVYSSGWFSPLGGCMLTVKVEATDVIYIPSSFSRTEFKGFWPSRTDEPVQLASGSHDDLDIVGGVDVPADETIDISFKQTQNGPEPVGYKYVNNKIRSETGGVADGEHECTGLRRIR